MTNRRLALLFILTSLAHAAQPVAAQSADLIVTDARINTVDEHRPLVGVIAIRDSRVIATGPDQDIGRVQPELILNTNVLATYLGGRAVFQKPVP
jgi:predicted amidohydrolase YtcJ